MASVWISFYKGLAKDRGMNPQNLVGLPMQDPTAITIGAENHTLNVPAGATIMRIAPKADCHVKWGTNATATVANADPFFANGEYYRQVDGVGRVSVIAAA